MTRPIRKKQVVKGPIPEKAWAIMFKHSLGWTATEIVFIEGEAETIKEKWQKKLSGFEYRVVPCEITFTPPRLKK